MEQNKKTGYTPKPTGVAVKTGLGTQAKVLLAVAMISSLCVAGALLLSLNKSINGLKNIKSTQPTVMSLPANQSLPPKTNTTGTNGSAISVGNLNDIISVKIDDNPQANANYTAIVGYWKIIQDRRIWTSVADAPFKIYVYLPPITGRVHGDLARTFTGITNRTGNVTFSHIPTSVKITHRDGRISYEDNFTYQVIIEQPTALVDFFTGIGHNFYGFFRVPTSTDSLGGLVNTDFALHAYQWVFPEY